MTSLLATIERQKLFQPGETVVVAVSGGADSVALLDILTRLEQGSLRLVVAHLNHCLRGAESDRDEAFVSHLAQSYGLRCVTAREDVAALAQGLGQSLEEAGRLARYRFLETTALDCGAASIALAHHRDDQAETVLLRLLRGAGTTGLSAMLPARGLLKRPLLGIARESLEDYLKERGLSWRTDESNSDTVYLRNSIRHELLPRLRAYNPRISERLAATAQLLALDEELLEGVTASAFARLARTEGEGEVSLPLAELLREAPGLRLRLYRQALRELRGDLRRIGLVHLEAVDWLARGNRPQGRLKLPGNCLVLRSYDLLRFSRREESTPQAWQLTVAGEGEHLLPTGATLRVTRVERPVSLVSGSPGTVYLDPDSAPFPWLLRPWAHGDRFRPLGMAGTQKVKELYINEKVPLSLRRRLPLLICRERILWVCGLRLAEEARVDPGAGELVKVEILEITP